MGPSGDFTTWLQEKMTSNESFRELPWKSVFPYLCHEIREDRNGCVFHGQEPSLIQVICFQATGSVYRWKYVPVQCVHFCFAHPLDCLVICVDAFFVGILEVVGISGVICGVSEKNIY